MTRLPVVPDEVLADDHVRRRDGRRVAAQPNAPWCALGRAQPEELMQ